MRLIIPLGFFLAAIYMIISSVFAERPEPIPNLSCRMADRYGQPREWRARRTAAGPVCNTLDFYDYRFSLNY